MQMRNLRIYIDVRVCIYWDFNFLRPTRLVRSRGDDDDDDDDDDDGDDDDDDDDDDVMMIIIIGVTMMVQ